MRHLSSICVLMFGLMATGLLRADDRAAGELTTYELKEKGFRLSAPTAWVKRAPSQNAAIVLRPDVKSVDEGPAQPTFMVLVITLAHPKETNLAKEVQGARNTTAKTPGRQISDNEETLLDGTKAIQYTYTLTINEHEHKSLRLISIHQGKLYMIGLSADTAAYDAAKPAFDKVLESFKWVP